MIKRMRVVVITLFISLSVYIGSAYNQLVNQAQKTEAAWAQVQNVYQRRLDLIPNLVSTVKGYTKHERETLEAVTKARAAMAGVSPNSIPDNQKIDQINQTQTALNSALGRLLIVVERYPDLKASQNYMALQVELAGTENRIAVERQRFNQTALLYNTTIRKFPKNIVAKLFGFQPTAYFQAPSNAQEASKVSF